MSINKITKEPYENFEKPGWWKRNWIEMVIIICGLCIINLIFIAEAFRETNTIDSTTAAQLGNFVGGYIGTIFGLVSVVLLYSTLKAQREGSAIQGFETKYFELIKMHRDNVAEIGIGDDFGKKIFVMLIREFREILEIVRQIALKNSLELTNEELFIISYYALFFGVGPNSSRMLKTSLSGMEGKFIEELEETLNDEDNKKAVRNKRKFKYTPFEGHQSRLGHYYRHLYQIISYIDKQELKIDKYEYVKTVRAQLTTHEQALLYINSLTPIGRNWWTKGFIVRYRFVQNIPEGFFEKKKEIDFVSYFPDNYFEWQEHRNTI